MLKKSIQFGIVIYGSNGDIELMVSLAMGLAAAGHKVKFFIISINRRDYAFLNKVSGIEVDQFPFPEEQLTVSEIEFWSGTVIESGDLMQRRYELVVDKIKEKTIELAQKCDVLVGPTYMFEVPSIAQKYHKLYISLRPFSGQIHSAYEVPYFLKIEEFPLIKDLSNEELWTFQDACINKAYKRRINKFRRELGIEPITSVAHEIIDSPWLNLIAYSNYLSPPKPDWSSKHHQCGFFKSPTYIEWDISDQLKAFIGDESPIFLTVGTMMEYESDRAGFRAQLLKLAHSLERKVIIHADWSEETIDNNAYLLRGLISYDKLIPLCALAVHHGGVGTAHIMTELGCPSIIISYGFEQPFNCKALKSQGVSGGDIARKDFCIKALKELIENALDKPELRLRAKQLGQLMAKENGVKKAVQLIEDAYQTTTEACL